MYGVTLSNVCKAIPTSAQWLTYLPNNDLLNLRNALRIFITFKRLTWSSFVRVVLWDIVQSVNQTHA